MRTVPRPLFVLLPLLVAVGHGAEPPAVAGPRPGNAALTYWRAFALMPSVDGDTDWAVRRALTQLTPLDGKLGVVIRQSEAALAELRRAAAQGECVWETPWDEGSDAKLPHLEKTRQLTRLAALRIRQQFEEGQASAGVEDFIAAMVLARRTGADGPLLTLLLELTVERNLIEVSAAYLPELNPGQLDLLRQQLDQLPAARTVHSATRSENEIYTGWLIRTLGQWDGKERVNRLLEGSKSEHTDALSALSREQLAEAALGLKEFYERLTATPWGTVTAFEQRKQELLQNPNLPVNVLHFASLALPSVESAQRAEAGHRTQLAMLGAALATIRQGPEALQQKPYLEPLANGPFEYLRWEHGFQLRSKVNDQRGKPIALTVGRMTAR